MIIAISGKAGSGKDTLGDIIKKLINDNSIEVVQFSGSIKKIAHILLGKGSCGDNVYSREFKDNLLSKYSFSMDSHYTRCSTGRDFYKKMADFYKLLLGSRIFIHILFRDYKTDDKWIITDVRYKNEVEAIKDMGGIVIRINRDSVVPVNHESEYELDDYEFDYVVENNSTIDDLKKEADKALKILKQNHAIN